MCFSKSIPKPKTSLDIREGGGQGRTGKGPQPPIWLFLQGRPAPCDLVRLVAGVSPGLDLAAARNGPSPAPSRCLCSGDPRTGRPASGDATSPQYPRNGPPPRKRINGARNQCSPPFVGKWWKCPPFQPHFPPFKIEEGGIF